MSLDTYREPVAKLLTYGKERLTDDWIDYETDAGLTQADIPELIRMATDAELDNLDYEAYEIEIFAPVHAARALGQLRAEEAIAPLITLFNQYDDYFLEDLPLIFAKIGIAAIAPLVDFYNDFRTTPPDVKTWGRIAVVESLKFIAEQYPEVKAECIAILMEWLDEYMDTDPIVVSCLVDTLVKMKVVEAAPLIEEIFAQIEVDEYLTGSLPSVQVELGLKQESDFSPEELKPTALPMFQEMLQILDQMRIVQRPKPQGFGDVGAPKPKSSKQKKKKKKK
jgi:hypothetical protein